jgi:hypothetical protein
MAKKVFKGWCHHNTEAYDIGSISTIPNFVCDSKKCANENWKKSKRVTVTVEVED